MFEIGSTLREARVRRNLTLQQVEEDIKIRAKYVQAMENEDFDIMPGSTYVKGFLSTYSTYLGLDAKVILEEYRTRGMRSSEVHEPFGGVSMLGSPRSHRRRNTAVVVAVVCLLALAVMWLLGQDGQTHDPVTQPSALGIASASPSPSVSATPVVSATPSIRAVRKNEVRVTASTGDSWVEVRKNDVHGEVLFSGTMVRGASKAFVAPVLWLRLGFPSAVTLRIEGTRAEPIREAGPLDLLVRNGNMTRTN